MAAAGGHCVCQACAVVVPEVEYEVGDDDRREAAVGGAEYRSGSRCELRENGLGRLEGLGCTLRLACP